MTKKSTKRYSKVAPSYKILHLNNANAKLNLLNPLMRGGNKKSHILLFKYM